MRAVAAATLRTFPRVALSLPPRFRRRLLAVLALVALLGAVYLVWFRNSSFVRVEKVQVTGLTTERAPQLSAALVHAARGMTTLNVDEGALLRSVRSDPVVRAVYAKPDFPHGLRIEVTENVPRALVVGAGRRVVVAGNGVVLTGQRPEGSLPTIRLGDPPATGRVGNPSAAELVEVAGAAPLALLGHLERITRVAGKGIVVTMTKGPSIYFGDTSQLEAKWADAAAILADRGSQGASYVDVRMPDRPVAGGLHLAPATPDGGSGATTAPGVVAPPPTQASPAGAAASTGGPAQAGPGPTTAAPAAGSPAGGTP